MPESALPIRRGAIRPGCRCVTRRGRRPELDLDPLRPPRSAKDHDSTGRNSDAQRRPLEALVGLNASCSSIGLSSQMSEHRNPLTRSKTARPPTESDDDRVPDGIHVEKLPVLALGQIVRLVV
jgi:hypothetical protein